MRQHTHSITNSKSGDMVEYQRIAKTYAKPGNKNQNLMLGTHMGFEINMVKFS